MENAAWHFKTNKGDWVVKVYAPHMVPFEKVVEETALYEYLNQHGIRVPKVLHSKKAHLVEKLETDMHEYPVMVMKFEEGLRFTRSASIQKDELVKIAQTVARMHQCLEHYSYHKNLIIEGEDVENGKQYQKTHDILATFPNARVYSSLVKIAQKILRIYRSLKYNFRCKDFIIKEKNVGYDTLITSPNVSVFTSKELLHIRVLDQQMRAYLSANSPTRHLTKSVIHGDLALEHAPFLQNGDVYLFDFTDHYLGSVAEELAVMLVHLYKEDELTFDRWEELKNWFLNGYTTVSHLTSDDLNTIESFIIRRILLEITYLCNISREIHREVDSEGNKRRYQLADYLLQTSRLKS